jgi:hypothetical protein
MAERLNKGKPQNDHFQTVLSKVIDQWAEDKRNDKHDLASRIGVDYRVLQYWLERDRCIPAEKIPLLCNALNDHRLLDELEKEAGRVAYHLPAFSKIRNTEDARAVQKLVKEVGEALQSLADTLEDGIVEPQEYDRTAPELKGTKAALLESAGYDPGAYIKWVDGGEVVEKR